MSTRVKHLLGTRILGNLTVTAFEIAYAIPWAYYCISSYQTDEMAIMVMLYIVGYFIFTLALYALEHERVGDDDVNRTCLICRLKAYQIRILHIMLIVMSWPMLVLMEETLGETIHNMDSGEGENGGLIAALIGLLLMPTLLCIVFTLLGIVGHNWRWSCSWRWERLTRRLRSEVEVVNGGDEAEPMRETRAGDAAEPMCESRDGVELGGQAYKK